MYDKSLGGGDMFDKINGILAASLFVLSVGLFSLISVGTAYANVSVPDDREFVMSGPDNELVVTQCTFSDSSLKAFGYTANGLHRYTIEKNATSGLLDPGCQPFINTALASPYPGENITPTGDLIVLTRRDEDVEPSRLRIYDKNGAFLTQHIVKNECNSEAKIMGFPVAYGDIAAVVYESCSDWYDYRIAAINIDTGQKVFDKVIGSYSSFQYLSVYTGGFVVREDSNIRLFSPTGLELVSDMNSNHFIDAQPDGTIVYESEDPDDSTSCVINFKKTNNVITQRPVTCGAVKSYNVNTLPSGDIVALLESDSSASVVPTIIYSDGRPNKPLNVKVPGDVYDDSFNIQDIYVDANGKIVVSYYYFARVESYPGPTYTTYWRGGLEIFNTSGLSLRTWNSASTHYDNSFLPGHFHYQLTNGAIYAINTTDKDYVKKIEKIAMPDISMGYRDSVRWSVDGVDLASYELKYLALGDSISSGEGDTERNPATGQKYYREYTDVAKNTSQNQPQEKCHLSTRSYPYLLSGWMKLGNSISNQWNSVACSGATTTDLNKTLQVSYEGQNTREGNVNIGRLHGLPNIEDLQARALNEFIPGREKQIEFIRKYKPRAVTLTAGANDIDFSSKLESCVVGQKALPNIGQLTCSWASGDMPLLASQIKEQYEKLHTLYTEIYEASGGQTKVYAVGYPQLVSDAEPAQCAKNVGFLDLDERKMIVRATNYLNEVIKQAAVRAGVKYVDISTSLNGGRLCEGSQQYMTGIAIVAPSTQQESFHPNDFGHIKITQAIKSALGNQSLLEFDNCPNTSQLACPNPAVVAPGVPNELGGDTSIKSKNENLTGSSAIKSTSSTFTVPNSSFKPNSSVNILLHSDPVSLGQFTASSNGGASGIFTIPSSVPTGYHTLILQGQTISGAPINLTQTLLVSGTTASDLDENGVPDTQQPCGAFITASGIDYDMDGIDDACDAEISTEPQLYRLRTGDVNRSYSGNPEHANYFYIERNTRASSITGVTGEYDPDGDGWAIVGASQGVAYTSTSAPDTAPAANFMVTGSGANAVPNIYVRAGDHGCVNFKPVSMAKVLQGQNRAIQTVEYNTDNCRQESADADVDGNGARDDDTQTLYVARQGDGFIGEDPNRIYLFRNFHAAEAQLGISDYSPTGTPAADPYREIQPLNLLAANNPSDSLVTFNKLVILLDGSGKPLPTVLARDTLSQCAAYQPSSMTVIKQATQSTRYLTKLTALPAGVNCD